MTLMNLNSFHYLLKKFLWSNEVLELIPDFGWNDGGCRSLMKAFQLWFDSDEVKTYQLVKKEDRFHSEHAFIKIGNFYLDGNGVSSHDQMEYTWLIEEGFPNVFIRQFDPENEPDNVNGDKPFYIDEERINKLVSLLDVNFNKEEVFNLLITP